MNTTKEKFKVRNALFEKEDKTDEELELEMEKKIKGISERVEVESKLKNLKINRFFNLQKGEILWLLSPDHHLTILKIFHLKF